MARSYRSFNHVKGIPSPDDLGVPANDNGASRVVRPTIGKPRGGAVIRLRRPANDDLPFGQPRAANDNILVTDDLPRPMPIMQGEGELVRIVLGARFLEILNGEDL